MKLKVDENLGAFAVELLEAGGHDVATVHAQGPCGGPNEVVAEACRRESRCLVTLDLDFANILRFPPGGHSGIASRAAGEALRGGRT